MEELYRFWEWGFSFLVKSTPITYIMCYFVAFSLYFCACSCRFIFSLKGFFEFSYIPDFPKCGECPYIRFSKNVGENMCIRTYTCLITDCGRSSIPQNPTTPLCLNPNPQNSPKIKSTLYIGYFSICSRILLAFTSIKI